MHGSFHGRTLAGIAATGQEKVKKGFEPPVQGFSHVPFNDGPALLAAVQEPGHRRDPARADPGRDRRATRRRRHFSNWRAISATGTACC